MVPRVVAVLLMLAAAACSADSPTRIVGGTPTTIEQYPSIVQIEMFFDMEWSQGCGGSILTTWHVLSAGHCFPLDNDIILTDEYRVRAGTTYRHVGGQVVPILRAITHPSLGVTIGYDGDMVVAQTERPLFITPQVQQAQIISQGFVLPDNLPVVYAGWGHTESGGTASPVLLDVTVYTINREICRERWLTNLEMNITENMLCAGTLDEDGRDACQGDSGGPLYFNGIVVGVVSFGYGCGNGTMPGVNTAVSSYTDWIVQTVAQLTI